MSLDKLLSQLEAATVRANNQFAASLPLANQEDYRAAIKGQIAQLPEWGVPAPSGRELKTLHGAAVWHGLKRSLVGDKANLFRIKFTRADMELFTTTYSY